MIIGIIGTIGAGKGTVADYLKEKGFKHFSARDYIVEEIMKRGLPVNRDSMNLVGESLRAEHGASYVIDQLYEKALLAGGDAVVEAVRTTGEVASLKAKDAVVVAVDADPRIRYERIVLRKSVTDHITYEKFLSDEARESHSEDPARINVPKCIPLADVVFYNDGDLASLHQQIDGFLTAQ
jgi:dephospho-CoA kinase